LNVILYTREDCGLCEETEHLLRRARKLIRFDLERVYIDNDKDLRELYGDRVPVVTVDGREIASAPVDEASLMAALSQGAKNLGVFTIL
jgi:glutaredoxin